MGKDKKEGLDFQDAILIFWIIAIVFLTLAPRDIRKDLGEYFVKFIGVIGLLIGVYVLYSITIKDKIIQRRKRKEQEELERFQQSARQRAQEWEKKQNKERRED